MPTKKKTMKKTAKKRSNKPKVVSTWTAFGITKKQFAKEMQDFRDAIDISENTNQMMKNIGLKKTGVQGLRGYLFANHHHQKEEYANMMRRVAKLIDAMT